MRRVLEQGMFDCIPEIDFNTGSRYFLGNIDNYTKALLSTLKSIKAKCPLLETMTFTKEYEGLRTITQALRRMFTNIGAADLAEETYQLETFLLNDGYGLVQEKLIGFINSLAEFSDHLELLLTKVDLSQTTANDPEQSSFLNYDFTKTKESIKKSSNLLGRKII